MFLSDMVTCLVLIRLLFDALQVIPQTEKIMARLKRLDEVLPKYQGIAGQLYELLKVKGLDDIVPAVNKLVS